MCHGRTSDSSTIPITAFSKRIFLDITNLPKCDVLVNFAAESFVDNSIENSGIFFKSNVNGVHNLLEHIRMKAKFDRPLFGSGIHR